MAILPPILNANATLQMTQSTAEPIALPRSQESSKSFQNSQSLAQCRQSVRFLHLHKAAKVLVRQETATTMTETVAPMKMRQKMSTYARSLLPP